MTDKTRTTSVASRIVKAFTDDLQHRQVSQKAKALMNKILEKAKGREAEADVHHFIETNIQEVPEPDKIVIEESWKNTQASIKLQEEKKPVPSGKQQVQAGVSSEHIEQKEDSFKFDSHSESYSSSYDDVDDDFRKEEMEQPQKHSQ